jgi:hypothetical protein
MGLAAVEDFQDVPEKGEAYSMNAQNYKVNS